jgi:hypothetical protein
MRDGSVAVNIGKDSFRKLPITIFCEKITLVIGYVYMKLEKEPDKEPFKIFPLQNGKSDSIDRCKSVALVFEIGTDFLT